MPRPICYVVASAEAMARSIELERRLAALEGTASSEPDALWREQDEAEEALTARTRIDEVCGVEIALLAKALGEPISPARVERPFPGVETPAEGPAWFVIDDAVVRLIAESDLDPQLPRAWADAIEEHGQVRPEVEPLREALEPLQRCCRLAVEEGERLFYAPDQPCR